MRRYKIEIFYSEEDEEYIAFIPDLPGCSAFGETEEEALKEVKIARELWLEVAASEGRERQNPKAIDNDAQTVLHETSAVRRLKWNVVGRDGMYWEGLIFHAQQTVQTSSGDSMRSQLCYRAPSIK